MEQSKIGCLVTSRAFCIWRTEEGEATEQIFLTIVHKNIRNQIRTGTENERFDGRRDVERRTLLVPGREDDGTGLVPHEALGDLGQSEVRRCRPPLLHHRLRVHHLHSQGVPARPRFQLIHLDEHRLPLRRRPSAGSLPLLLLPRRRRCRHPADERRRRTQMEP